ncbi:MAG: rhodanese-like domain-containing protein [Chthoniobacteraceae bacterium]
MNSTLPQVSPAIAPAELHRLRLAGAACELIDVRTPPEHAAGHVPGVQLVPLDSLDPTAFLSHRADPTAPLYVFCQAGGRAKKAIEKFHAAGFDGCVLVEGGTQAWIDAGLPIDRGTSRVLPLMRQVHLTIGFFTTLGAVLALTIDPLFALLPVVTGCGLLINGSTGWCGLALLVAKMPWNRGDATTSCSR